jgi:hypothetical protein
MDTRIARSANALRYLASPDKMHATIQGLVYSVFLPEGTNRGWRTRVAMMRMFWHITKAVL